jgi:multiple sugar transport system substrate-binding protein
MFYGLYCQQAPDMVFHPGKKAKYDEATAVKTLEFMVKMLDDTVAQRSADDGTAEAEFLNQGSGIFFSGVWETPTLKTAGIPFDAEPIPTLYDKAAAYADSHTFVLPHQDDPDPKKREDVHRFVATILKHSVSWGTAGHIPAYLPVDESAAYKKLLPQAHYASASEIVHYDPSAWFTGAGSDFQTDFGNAIQSVLLRQSKPLEGWNAFVQRVNKFLSEPNPAV